tara:strand:+ start:495 stop:662 length:168 start_codon:yes stop_codon:yes gene_type:complete
MSVSYYQTQQKHVRVTLDLTVEDDFNARQIDWRKLFELDQNEKVNVHVEDLDNVW